MLAVGPHVLLFQFMPVVETKYSKYGNLHVPMRVSSCFSPYRSEHMPVSQTSAFADFDGSSAYSFHRLLKFTIAQNMTLPYSIKIAKKCSDEELFHGI
jgi:hypothetical protein